MVSGRQGSRQEEAFVPPPCFMNIEEPRELHIPVEHRRDPDTGDYFEKLEGMMFKEGFLYKTVSMKSISSQNIRPTFDELEKFRKPGGGDGDKKGPLMKDGAVIVVKGDLKNLMGWVEKVEEDNVHIRPKMKDLPKTLAVNEKELCKYFKPGDHVKVVSGAQEGATGMVVKVEYHVLILVSDTTKEDIRVFADHVVESSEVTSCATKIGDYELHDLVLLDNMSFGVIIRVESEAFQVLKGVPDRPEVALVKLREIKSKIERRSNAQDRSKNTVSVKDVVRIVGIRSLLNLFIIDRHHLEHAGYICAKAQSCIVIGVSRSNDSERNVSSSIVSASCSLKFYCLLTDKKISSVANCCGNCDAAGGRHRSGHGHDSLVGSTIKIRLGPFKGYRGRVVDVNGQSVRVELESQMKVFYCTNIFHLFTSETPRYGMGSETPMHPSRTLLHPYMTPMRDPGATPIHDGMRTPMRDQAWNPFAPMSPARFPGTPPVRSYEAPTPGSGWTNTTGCNYIEAGTPRDNSPAYVVHPYLPSTPGQPLTPGSASYLPGTPGGQPMTPGNGGLDLMPLAIGGEVDGPWFTPDILVNLRKFGEDAVIGVVRDVLPDGSCKVSLGSSGNGETVVTALPNELEMVVPRKSDKIKIMSGAQPGATGKLIGVDGTDGIVKVDDTLDVKILDMVIAKLAQP
ncbi:KOW [Macleaya cordata]|uniref:Transcription elongation factor SPT5 n=1 Tax=Macleaya cordata TaxID=56857 RepID=A0A200QAJ4_MACCD|nr:KOW [Macleaya cordata]